MPDNKQFQAEHRSPFNSDSLTIMHNESSVILDFKQTTPRFDQFEGDSQHTIITEHNTVVLQPTLAKVMLNILEKNVKDYEEKFGEIEVPESPEDDGSSSPDIHSYIG